MPGPARHRHRHPDRAETAARRARRTPTPPSAAALKAGADGVVLSRKYSEMRLEQPRGRRTRGPRLHQFGLISCDGTPRRECLPAFIECRDDLPRDLNPTHPSFEAGCRQAEACSSCRSFRRGYPTIETVIRRRWGDVRWSQT